MEQIKTGESKRKQRRCEKVKLTCILTNTSLCAFTRHLTGNLLKSLLWLKWSVTIELIFIQSIRKYIQLFMKLSVIFHSLLSTYISLNFKS